MVPLGKYKGWRHTFTRSEGYWNYAELTSDELISTGTKYKIDKKPSMALNEDNLNKWIKIQPSSKEKQVHMNKLQKESPKILMELSLQL